MRIAITSDGFIIAQISRKGKAENCVHNSPPHSAAVSLPVAAPYGLALLQILQVCSSHIEIIG